MKYVTVDEMIAIEKEADAQGHTYSMMMERAGKGLAEVVHDTYSHLDRLEAFGLVGSGNNGGDTLVAFSYLQEWGWKTTSYIVRPRKGGDPLVKRLKEAGGKIILIKNDQDYEKLRLALNTHPVVLDGVLGTGIKLPLRGKVAEALELGRDILPTISPQPHVVAVDCPSGVDCDSGEAATQCIPAEMTVTMAAFKRGLLRFPAYNLVGELKLVGIGLPEGLQSYSKIQRRVADPIYVREILPLRPLDAHKGTFGTAMVVAGSINYTGAALLAGQAAYRIGAGLVTCGVPTPLYAVLAGQFPEGTWLLLPHEMGVIAANAAKVVSDNLERVTAVLVGPGFGVEDTTKEFLSRIIGVDSKKMGSGLGFVKSRQGDQAAEVQKLPPLVIDADGLKLLAKIPDWNKYLGDIAVLTPHPGEMAVLTGLSTYEIQADRVGVAERYAQDWGHVVVLKGAHTVVASPDGHTAIIPVASPALARAGTGDVLAGLIVGLRAQGVEAFQSAVAGSWIHAHAGVTAADILGSTAAVLAGDVLSAVVDVLAYL